MLDTKPWETLEPGGHPTQRPHLLLKAPSAGDGWAQPAGATLRKKGSKWWISWWEWLGNGLEMVNFMVDHGWFQDLRLGNGGFHGWSYHGMVRLSEVNHGQITVDPVIRVIPMPRLARDAVHTAMRGYTGVCVGHGARMNCSWERRCIEFKQNSQKTVNSYASKFRKPSMNQNSLKFIHFHQWIDTKKIINGLIFHFSTALQRSPPPRSGFPKADSQHHCEDLRRDGWGIAANGSAAVVIILYPRMLEVSIEKR